MNPQSHTKNPLIHNGTSQQERLLKMLLPQNYQLDDHSFKDLLVAAHQFAGMLYYYDETNTPNGYWQCFWEVEPLTFLAAVAALDTDGIAQGYEDLTTEYDDQLRRYHDEEDDTCTTDPTDDFNLKLITYIYEQAKRIESFNQTLPNDLPIKREILSLINKTSITDTEQLVTALALLIGYHKAIDNDLDHSIYEFFFSEHWNLPDQQAYDSARFKPNADYTSNRLQTLFHTFYLAIVKIRQRADYWFEQTLATPQLRQPHVALFLTFLHLFRHAQHSLNGLTKRHLDYYYTEALCLDRRAETPDEVYLIFELAKDFDSYLIEKGTELLAGKDKNRKPLLFETIEDWVLNKAKVAEIKNIYFDHKNKLQATGKIYAAPDARLPYKDGVEETDKTDAGWRAFGDDGELPLGEIGFAIASPQLILREGKRIVDVDLKLELTADVATAFTAALTTLNNLPTPKSAFRLELSSPEEETGWISNFKYVKKLDFISTAVTEDSAAFGADFENTISTKTLKFRIILNPEDSPVDTLTEALAAQYRYSAKWPTLKVMLADDIGDPAEFYATILRKIKVTGIEIRVDVKGIREELIVQSDLGLYDGTQKFLPFGPVPERGNQFYIGSTEVFQKALKSLIITFEWIDAPSLMFTDAANDYYTTYFDLLNPQPNPPDANHPGDPLPKPFLQIDFIDKANEIPAGLPERIAGYGNFTNSITGRVVDVYNIAIAGVTVSAKKPGARSPFVTTTTNSDGYYTLTGLSTGDVISFSSSNPLLESFPFGQDKIIVLDSTPDTPTEQHINYATVNVALYPKRITSKEEFTGNISGVITDLLSGAEMGNIEVSVKDVAAVTPSISSPQGVFELFDVPSGSITLVFTYVQGTERSKVEMNVEAYPKLKIRLLPPPDINRSSAGGGNIEGSIQDSNNILLNEVLIIGKDTSGNVVTRATSNVNGAYNIVRTNLDTLEFQYGGFKPLIVKVNSSNEINLIYFTDYITKKAVIKGKITDSSNNPALNAKIQIQGIATSLVTVDNAGNYTLIDVVFKGAPITFDINYNGVIESVAMAIEGDSEVNIVFPTGGSIPAPSVNLLSNALSGNIKTYLQGVHKLFEKVKVTLKNTGNQILSEASSDNSGNYSLNVTSIPFTLGFKLEFSYPGHQKLVVPLTGYSTIDITIFSQQRFKKITGKVTDVFDQPLQNVRIAIGNVALGQDEITTLPTNEDGEYEFFLPEDNSFLSLGDENMAFSFIDFAPTKVDKTLYNRYSNLDIRLYNILNIFPLINNSGSIIKPFDININTLNLKRDVRTQKFLRYSPTLKRGFVRLTLTKGDFLHKEYQNVLIQQTIKLSNWLSVPANTDNDPNTPEIGGTRPLLPGAPYTPATNTIRLDYASTQVVMGEENDGIDQFFHLLPFNGFQAISLDVETAIALVEPYYQPSFGTSLLFAQGNLYIGLQDLKPGENVSLLIKVLEGSERDSEALPPLIVWSYLTKDNQWTPFSASQVLKDTTKGLTHTGMIQFATSKKMVKENTLLNDKLYWIRASAQEETVALPLKSVAALPDLVSIQAQVIQVRFRNEENDLSHLAKSLPATTINKLAVSRAAVKKVEQPYASFNGRLPETVDNSTEYYIRISERLRHRNRAITIWDYERIMLEQFPKVRRAKCISHANQITELASGYVMVAVIPDLTKRDTLKDITPDFSQGDLQEMAEYLRTKANYFVGLKDEQSNFYLQVVNPKYETILLDFQVKFYDNVDKEAHRFILDKELKEFLCFWLTNSASDISFGMPLHRSRIIEFIEQRKYVDAMAKLRIYKDGQEVTTEAVYPLSSRSILTTFVKLDKSPDDTDHNIEVAEEKNELCEPTIKP